MRYRSKIWRVLAEADSRLSLSKLTSNTNNAIVNYHSISNTDSELFGNLSIDRFRRDVEFLKTNYELVDLPGVLSNIDGSNKKIAVTFDDGYRNFYENAVPTLEEFNVPATVFVNPSFIGDASKSQFLSAHAISEPSTRIFMNSSEIRELVDSELITIGNHTSTHPNLSNLTDKDVLEDEIIGAKHTLEEEFGITVDRFSYPYGGYNQAALDVVRRSHTYGAGTIRGQITDGVESHRLPRIHGHRSEPVVRWELTDTSQRIRNSYERLSF